MAACASSAIIGTNATTWLCTHAHTDHALFRRRIVRLRNFARCDASRVSAQNDIAVHTARRGTPESFSAGVRSAGHSIRNVRTGHVSAWSHIRARAFSMRIIQFNQRLDPTKYHMTSTRDVGVIVQN
jgi:hypothetical protein